MKSSKRIIRLALVAAVTAAVSMPIVNQLRKSKAADAPTPPAPVAAGQPQGPKMDAPVWPQVDDAKVVLSVGDLKVTAGEFKKFFTELDPQLQQRVIQHPEAKRQLAEQFVDMKLMADEAKHLKLDDSLRVKTAYEQILFQALMMHLAEDKIGNSQFFDSHQNFFDELQARHILIGVLGGGVGDAKLTDAQAKAKADDIKKRLDKGEDFAALARVESDDKGSAATGGSLGTMSRGQMVPPFEAAAYDLKVNEISQPVKSQFGYHIIQVLGRTTPKYEAVEAAQRIPRRRMEMIIEDLKKSSNPQIDDSFFGAAAAKPDSAKSAASAPATAPASAPTPAAAPVPAPAPPTPAPAAAPKTPAAK